MSKSIYDIREDEIKIKNQAWDNDFNKLLFAKHMMMAERCVQYNKWLLQRGRKYFDRYDGRILDRYQIAEYEDVEKKIVLQPPIMKSPIRALSANALKSRKSGQITIEGGDMDNPVPNPDELTTINVAMKDFEKKTKEQYRFRDLIHDAFVSCYPNALYYYKRKPSSANPLKIGCKKMPWDSVAFGPLKWNEPDGSDISELFWLDWRSEAELIEDFPEMKAQIEAHCNSEKKYDSSAFSSIKQWDGSITSKDRDYLNSILEHTLGSITATPDGLWPVVQHIFPIKRKEEVWINVHNEDLFETRPPDWGDDRWKKWVADNKENYEGPYERPITTLWMVTFTKTGLVLCNEKHWFQEDGQLPLVIYVPAMISGIPSGPAADMSEEVLRNCVAEIEKLDDLRKGNGILALFKEGAIKNIEAIPAEANKAFGVGIVNNKFKGSANDAVHTIERQSGSQWGQYAQQTRQDMYENTRINETMQGASAPRQAAIAKNLEIAQALLVNAMYIDNMNLSWENLQNLKLLLIPYCYDTYDILEIFDEETKRNVIQPVNVPVIDNEGNKTEVINDLTAHRYRWKINPVDDSSTTKAQAMEDALSIFNSAAGPLMQSDSSGKLFSRFLQAAPNEWLNKMGKAMQEDADAAMKSQAESGQQKDMKELEIKATKAQAELEKARKAGINLDFTGEQFAQYPNLLNLYLQLKAMQEQGAGAAGGPGGASAQPAQPPTMQPPAPPAPPVEIPGQPPQSPQPQPVTA